MLRSTFSTDDRVSTTILSPAPTRTTSTVDREAERQHAANVAINAMMIATVQMTVVRKLCRKR
jgi:hypothetical protein